MKDVTTTSFGLIIAYLLPGLVGLYSLTFWSESARRVSLTFLNAQSDFGLSLMVLAGSVVVGLEVNVLRFLVYERVLCRTKRLGPGTFRKLTDDTKVAVFTAVIEENFRYHQFFGSMTLLLPMIYPGFLMYLNDDLGRDFWFLFFTGLFVSSLTLLILLWYEIKTAGAGLKRFLWCYPRIQRRLIKTGRRRAEVLIWVFMGLVIIIYLLWLSFYQGVSNWPSIGLFTLSFAALELATGAGAIVALRRYVERIENIFAA